MKQAIFTTLFETIDVYGSHPTCLSIKHSGSQYVRGPETPINKIEVNLFNFDFTYSVPENYVRTIFDFSGRFCSTVLNVHLEELSCLLVGKTSRLGVVLRESDSF